MAGGIARRGRVGSQWQGGRISILAKQREEERMRRDFGLVVTKRKERWRLEAKEMGGDSWVAIGGGASRRDTTKRRPVGC